MMNKSLDFDIKFATPSEPQWEKLPYNESAIFYIKDRIETYGDIVQINTARGSFVIIDVEIDDGKVTYKAIPMGPGIVPSIILNAE